MTLMTASMSVYAGRSSDMRYLAVGVASTDQIVVLGQEIAVEWRGSRKIPRWDDNDVRIKRGRTVLLVDGREREISGPDPLGGESLSVAAFDESSNAFVLLRRSAVRGPDVCRRLSLAGESRTCDLPRLEYPGYPAGFYFDSAAGYFVRSGAAIRFSKPVDHQRHLYEWDFEAKTQKEVEAALPVEAMRIATMAGRLSGCARTGVAVSPDDRKIAVFCGRKLELHIGENVEQIPLPMDDSWENTLSLGPLSSDECVSHPDSVAIEARETAGLTWSHDSAMVYWCPRGSKKGILLDVSSGSAFAGPCLRSAAWRSDDSTIYGITECGHAIATWERPNSSLH
ncbi:MAG TPA: hypothetical protein VGS03_01185 [Candidatus Polarisedimenticolia bacterium]|nr:hypothetical protein [Candidatus Polarisedimenticolia bacterium]